MNITKATPQNIQELAPMLDQFRQLYGKNPEISACEAYLEKRLSKEESIIFIASSDSETYGYIQLYPMFSTVLLQKLWMLSDLFIKPEFRKNGYAMQLINHAKSFAEDTNLGLIIETRITNNSALKFYDSVGFKKFGEHLYYFLENEN